MSLYDGRGKWTRYTKRDLVTDYLRLHVRDVQRYVDPARLCQATLTWSRSGRQIGTLTVVNVPEQGVTLLYSTRGESVSERIDWDNTTPHYGGQRRWWLCPRCGRRCAALYGGPRFYCRLCHGLTYRSAQSGGKLIDSIDDRLCWLRDKLQDREHNIADSVPPAKPPTMRFRTYERLFREWLYLHRLRDDVLNLELINLVRGLPEMPDVAPIEELDMTEMQDMLRGEWRRRRERIAEPPEPYYWPPTAPEEPAMTHYEPERYTLGELATAAGVPHEFAQEAQRADLLRPDGGRGTRVRRYRPRLATWLGKLYTLRQAEWSWDDIRAWCERRFQPGHEHEVRWPANFTPPTSSS